jgi:integrase
LWSLALPPRPGRTTRPLPEGVPLPKTLHALLVDRVARTERGGDDFVFGATRRSPFSPSYVRATADRAWKVAGIPRVTLHECRHGYASFLDAAGISEARADRYLGHAGTTVGDRYRHRLRGQLESDGALLDAYLRGSIAPVIPLRPTGVAPADLQERVSATRAATPSVG